MDILLSSVGVAVVACLLLAIDKKFIQKQPVSFTQLLKQGSFVFAASIIVIYLKNNFLHDSSNSSSPSISDNVSLDISEQMDTGEPGF